MMCNHNMFSKTRGQLYWMMSTKLALYKLCQQNKWYISMAFVGLVLYTIWIEQKTVSSYTWNRINVFRQEQESLSDIPRISPKKVLLYTYMRGGSSYFGEIFHHNWDAVYWFEPMDSFYEGLFGMRPLVKPLNILYYSNQTQRSISDEEVQAIVQFHKQLYDCEYSKLPVTTFTTIHNSKSSLAFGRCGITPKSFDKCSKHLIGVCTAETVAKSEPLTTNVVYSVKNQCMKSIMTGFEGKPVEAASSEQLAAFERYMECHKQKKQVFLETCCNMFTDKCQNTRIQAVKNIRITMETIKQMMVDIPDLYLVYYIRDPRGIISSRMALDGLLTFKPLQETKLLCRRMALDLELFRELDTLMPQRVLLQRYEDFAKDPTTETESTYRFIDEPIPSSVTQWIQKGSSNSINLKKANLKFSFGTTRQNSTDVSIAWRRQLPESLIEQLSEICAEVIEQLHYDV